VSFRPNSLAWNRFAVFGFVSQEKQFRDQGDWGLERISKLSVLSGLRENRTGVGGLDTTQEFLDAQNFPKR
jgi:hypothetical protein